LPLGSKFNKLTKFKNLILTLPLVPIEQLDNLWLIIESEKPDNNQKVEEF